MESVRGAASKCLAYALQILKHSACPSSLPALCIRPWYPPLSLGARHCFLKGSRRQTTCTMILDQEVMISLWKCSQKSILENSYRRKGMCEARAFPKLDGSHMLALPSSTTSPGYSLTRRKTQPTSFPTFNQDFGDGQQQRAHNGIPFSWSCHFWGGGSPVPHQKPRCLM
jgi:hypothetical protein